MKSYFKALAVVVAVAAPLTLQACASNGLFSTISSAYTHVVDAWKGSQKTVYTVRASYDGLLAGASAFKSAECAKATNSVGGISCSVIVPQLRKADATAVGLLDQAEKFVRANPKANATTLIAAAEGAVEAYAQVMDKYGVPSK